MKKRAYWRLGPGWRFLAVFAALSAIYVLWLPDVDWLRKRNPKSTAYVDAYVESVRAKGKKPKVLMHWIKLEDISPYLRRAVLLSEDDMFYSHEGVDWDSVRQAIDYDIRKFRLARGGSTITQQVARNIFLTSSKNPLRKLKEILIARKLERVLGKRRILEIYLNIAEWGEGIYGAEAASRAYFGKEASGLGLEEAVELAAALPNPRRFNPARKAGPGLQKRRRSLLERMNKSGYSTSAEY